MPVPFNYSADSCTLLFCMLQKMSVYIKHTARAQYVFMVLPDYIFFRIQSVTSFEMLNVPHAPPSDTTRSLSFESR